MDPNAALLKIRAMISQINSGDFDETSAANLAEVVESLDEWLSKGGHRPDAWSA